MIYGWIANYLGVTNIGLIFLCIQHPKSSIKNILSKIFEQNADYEKVDELSTPSFSTQKMISSAEK